MELVSSLTGDSCKVEEYTAVAANDLEKDKKLQLKKDSTVNVKFRSVKSVGPVILHVYYTIVDKFRVPF